MKNATAVVVENYHNPASLRLESDAVARDLAEQLKLQDVAPIVDTYKIETLRQTDGGAYSRMPLDAIGRAVEAKQVIYVDLERFDITHALASDVLEGHAEARVRVVDEVGTLLWPLDSAAGYPVTVKINPQRNKAGAGEAAVRRLLHEAIADRVAKLFYNWQAEGADGAEQKFE